MKLRNKKTGEVDDFLFEVITNRIDLYRRVGSSDTKNIWKYNTLAELNADWEDYKPAEPLIKDEKIRKAVRAWAKANGLDGQPIYFSTEYNRFCDAPHFIITIDFYNGVKGEGLHGGYSYYLDELCGEEE